MQPIRVLQVFTILNRGGAEANIMNYYRNIDTTKIQFDFLVHRQEEGLFEKEIEQLGGRVFRLPAVNPFNLKEYKKAVKVFFDSHPDYQIVHGQLSELGVFIYEEAEKRKIPIIIAHAHNSKMSWDIKAPFRIWWKSRMKKSINTYFTCGIDSAKWLFGEKLAEKAYSMNNAVSVSKFQFNSEIRQKLRTDLGSENTINIVNVARFNKQKNHIFLLDVFAEVVKLKQRSNYHLYLVGEGGLKEEIVNKIDELGIKDNVTLLGVRNDVEMLLQAMDIYFFPSLFEGLPVSLIEVQSSGIKCVISDGIPGEAILVEENIEVVSLQKSKEYWAEKIIENSIYERQDVSDIIRQKGYDIAENARLLEIKYTELLQNLS